MPSVLYQSKKRLIKETVTLNSTEPIINTKFEPTNKKIILHFVRLELFLRRYDTVAVRIALVHNSNK